MKKNTLALCISFLVFLTFNMQAQTFPGPYCMMADNGASIEEITSVDLDGTSMTNSDTSVILIDKTATIVNVAQGETYTIEVGGNTYGNFNSDIVAFIDWNQNDILDDAGEIYELGTLINSDGTDGVSVVIDITVPIDALEGATRIRITKSYQDEDSPAGINPCAIEFYPFGYGPYEGYGQALDFTLQIEAAPVVTFPEPYCNITDSAEVMVEEISAVNFAGTSITNTDVDTVLIDETATIVNVAPGEKYTLQVEGNTNGNFDTDIVAFIDWNQNNLLDDAGEIYEIGTLTNTDGMDGVFVTMDILVPADALEGTTRMRLTKTYQDEDSPAGINPCAVEFYPFGYGPYAGYGQALDFTLNISALSVDVFETKALSVYPIPTKDVLNISYKTALTAVKIYNLLGQEVYHQNLTSSKVQLNVSSLHAGAYIVNLSAPEGTHSFRIIKQ